MKDFLLGVFITTTVLFLLDAWATRREDLQYQEEFDLARRNN